MVWVNNDNAVGIILLSEHGVFFLYKLGLLVSWWKKCSLNQKVKLNFFDMLVIFYQQFPPCFASDAILKQA